MHESWLLQAGCSTGSRLLPVERSIHCRGLFPASIKVIDQNQYLAEMVRCVVVNGNEQEEFFADRNAVINIALPKAEKIYLQHQLFPDILSLIKDENNHNTYFEVTLNPTLQNVSFKGIDLTIDADTLHMPINYFMPFKNIRFVKQ